MSFICIVCRDLLTLGEDEPQGAAAAFPDDRDPVEIVATRCGHLYHQHCLLGWFNTQGLGRAVRECPYCKTVINGPGDYLKIYPSGDEETDEIRAANTQQTQSLDVMRVTVQELQNTLAHTNERLEGESMEHDILKVAHSELMCELNRAKADVEKLTEKLTVREDAHVLKCETLKKEKDDATRTYEILLAESKRNQEQNERLQKTNLDAIEELKAQVRELQALRDIAARESGMMEKACQTVYQDSEEIKSCLDIFAECIERMGNEKTKLEKVLVDRQGQGDDGERETLIAEADSSVITDISDESNVQDEEGEGDVSTVASSADSSFWNTTFGTVLDGEESPATKPRPNNGLKNKIKSERLSIELDNIRPPGVYVSSDEDESDSSSESDNIPTPKSNGRATVTPFAAANAAVVNTF